MAGDADAAGIHANSVKFRMGERDIQHCLHVLAAIAVRLVAPFAGLAEGRFRFPRSAAEYVAAAAASRILVIRRKHQVSGLGQRLHQEFCLCIAACEAMRKND
jgi:hypothetical protein